MKDKTHKRQKFKKTTIILPYDLWESLRIESIKRNTSMGKLIAKKLRELEELRQKDRHHANGQRGTSQTS